jgi:hypothetical protein
MGVFKLTSTWLCLFILLLCWIVICLDITPTAVNDSPADTGFHVNNALAHLNEITREPHSLGTPANDRVRDYLDSACRSLGLEVRQLPFTVTQPISKGVIVARGINIAATLHATATAATATTSTAARPASSASLQKAVLVMAHYDSEPNALGAGDDGSACAAMLECMRALRAGPALQDDVEFLFTNGEEDGLLGALAFARDTAELRNIGLVLNFDGRGDRGHCLMFRTSSDNDWVVRQFARADIHHGAASLYSELFKLLPNNTDFSPFQSIGKPGLDFAFAEGFTSYHNLTDNIENIDKRMMQEQGDNMLGSIRHFGRLDLRTPPANRLPSNTTYFNLIGGLFIHYSLSVNFLLLLLTNALVLFALVFAAYRKTIRLTHALLGLIVFPLALVVLYFFAGWTWDAVGTAWPLYLGYYPNAYNSTYFYLALAAEALTLFSVVYIWPVNKWSMPSLYIAILVCITILLDVCYRYIPAGVYFLYFPLIGAAFLATFLPQRTLPRILAVLPAILFFAPLIYALAELFDSQSEAAMVAPITGLLLGLLLPVLTPSLRQRRWFIPVTSAAVMFIAAGIGIFHGGYSPDKPFKTDIRYFAESATRQAWWVTHNTRPDRGNATYLKTPTVRPNAYTYTLATPPAATELFSPAPFLDLPAATLTLTKDTLIDGHRILFLHCQPAAEPPAPSGPRSATQAAAQTTTIHINFTTDHPADSISIADAQLSGPLGWLEYIAPPANGFDFTIACHTASTHSSPTPHLQARDAASTFTITVISRSMGLPTAAGFHGYPADVIPTAASYANTTTIQRVYTF